MKSHLPRAKRKHVCDKDNLEATRIILAIRSTTRVPPSSGTKLWMAKYKSEPQSKQIAIPAVQQKGGA